MVEEEEMQTSALKWMKKVLEILDSLIMEALVLVAWEAWEVSLKIFNNKAPGAKNKENDDILNFQYISIFLLIFIKLLIFL